MKNLKQYILLIAICIFLQNTYSQNCISPEWLINSTGEDWDVVCDMITNKDGFIYLIGNYTASTKFSEDIKQLTGDDNTFIAKFNAKGGNVWLHQINSTDYCHIASISTDLSGSIYVCGNFKGEIDTDEQTLISSKNKNAFIIKMDNEGDVVWSKQINGNFLNNKLFLKNDSENNLIFTGSFTGTLNIDSTTYQSKYFSDILIAKFNDKSEVIASKVFEGSANDLINDIAINKNNEIFLTGSFENELIISDIVLESQGRKDAFLIKLDTNFQVVFSKQIAGIYDDYGQNISIDSEDNILLAGSFSDKIQLSKEDTIVSNGLLDVFLIKYDKNCIIIWAESFGGFANDYQSSIAINNFNNIYLTGTYRGEINKKESQINSSNFSTDIFLAKYNYKGDFRFIESIGDTNTDFGKKLIIDTANYIYLSGNFTNSLKIVKEKTNNAIEEDFFLSKLYDCDEAIKVCLPADTSLCGGSYTIIADIGFSSYFWNESAGDNTFSVDTTGMYHLQVADKYGCISTDSIEVIINTPIEVYLGDDLSVHQGEIVTFFANSGFEKYLWNTKDTTQYIEFNTGNLTPGTYTINVFVIDTNHCTNSDELKLEVIGREEPKSVRIVSYPNPAKDYLLFQILNLKPQSRFQLQLISLEGTLIWNEEYQIKDDNFNKRINLQQLNPGTYYLRVKYEDDVKVLRIVKM